MFKYCTGSNKTEIISSRLICNSNYGYGAKFQKLWNKLTKSALGLEVALLIL